MSLIVLSLYRPYSFDVCPRTLALSQARADRLEAALDELSRNAETAMAADESRRAIHRAAAEAHAEDLLSAQARPSVPRLVSRRKSKCQEHVFLALSFTDAPTRVE
jgi:hypothetical protein